MSLNTGFQGLPVQEVVPDAAQVKGLSKSSLLVSRRRIRFQPQTGTTANPGSIIQFVLADSTSLLDMNSAVISFTATTTGTGVETLDDGASWCRRLQVSLNGNLVEDIDHAHRLTNMEVYAAADKSWYQSSGSFAGFWKFNPDLASADPNASTAGLAGATWGAANAATNSTVLGGVLQGYNPGFGDVPAVWTPASVRTAAGTQLAVPLSIMSGLFRTKQYMPISQMGEMVLQFTCASAAEAVFQATGNTDGNYSLSNIFMEIDVVQPHYLYAELLNKITQSEGESGLVIPYESAIVSQGQAITSGTASVIVSRATNNLRRIVYANQLTAGIASINFPSVSAFAHSGITSWQVRCGSLYFPSQPADSDARLYYLTQTAYGAAVNTKPGLMNRNTFLQTTSTAGAATEGFTRNTWSDSCVIAYCFDNYKNTAGTNVLDADGLSVLGQAGSQVVIQITQTQSATPVVALVATRYISLMNGTLKIVGV